mmetsp:Transcript_64694/g.145947  ORF Transcript_64694/g.145947 Transcript_64694/m.145947 type:complete len:88 (-) Transcript_64694:1626-1889(-)
MDEVSDVGEPDSAGRLEEVLTWVTRAWREAARRSRLLSTADDPELRAASDSRSWSTMARLELELPEGRVAEGLVERDAPSGLDRAVT